jgi:penicillin-binding protein A
VNRELKRLSLGVLAMFVALFTAATIIQVAQADSLRVDSRNSRTLAESYQTERGAILVGGDAVVESKSVKDQYKFLRVYEHPKLYSAVTGYFTLNQGSTGVEGALNDELSGTSSSQFFDKLKGVVSGQDPKGASVELTIDKKAQKAAYKALKGLKGSVVAIEPSTGRILAMVSRPSYNPNRLSGHSTVKVLKAYNSLINNTDDPLVNDAIGGDENPPGSTFKMITASAALESGKFTAKSKVKNPSTLTLSGTSTTINNAEGESCGGTKKVTMAFAFQDSCNIPFAEIGLRVGAARLRAMAKAYGFGATLDIPQKTTASIFPDTLDASQTQLSSFGQYEVRATPLQMAMVTSAIANDGVEMTPNLVDRVVAANLSTISKFTPTQYSQPISSTTAETLTQMMTSVVEAGTGTNARIDGVTVAGKTGTAENGDGPYSLWFTGFAPADDPQVAVAVVVEDGGGLGQSGTGNSVAAPIAKKVIEAVLNK